MANLQQSKSRAVEYWLLIGVVLVFFQIVIGGITRLTDSGLSITEWDIILGVMPPLNNEAWQLAFEEYQVHAAKQHESLHADMTISSFKWIYFWEWFHRLWARSIGLIFLFPFLWFVYKKQISKTIIKRLGIVILLAACAAIFGWLMVKSGLNRPDRTWVSAYMLSAHLLIATSLISYLFWTYLIEKRGLEKNIEISSIRSLGTWTVVVVFIQIIFGGWMAGMRAGFVHMDFPLFWNSGHFFSNLLDFSQLNIENFIDYERHVFVKTWVHFFHRITAYLLVFLVIKLWIKTKKIQNIRLIKGHIFLIITILLQFLLGIFTVVNYADKSALVVLGTLHQAGAFLLLFSVLYIRFQCKSK